MAQFNLDLRFRLAFLAALLSLTSGVCIDLDLGVGNGIIQDSCITASSVHNATTPAKNGRLNYISGSSWCAGTSDPNPYLQIDLQKLHIICAVSTQGNSQADQWVKSYTLLLSTNGTNWTDYKEGGKAKVLKGNNDRNSGVKHVIYRVLTRYLRFLPKTHQGRVCMRIEVFGVEKMLACDRKAIGLADGGKIPDSSFTATSIYNCMYLAQNGRLNKRRAWAPKRTNNADDYLQIDLLYEYIICAVATQGNPVSSVAEWTTHYKIHLSLNSATFDIYKENNNDKVFLGNTDKDSPVINSLDEFASARFIRFVPTQYQRWKSLRVEVYGVLLSKVPSKPPAAFKLTVSSSTSITAYWQLPPVFARHGRTITGFKMFYREKGSAGSFTFLNIGSKLGRLVTGLDKYKEYEFQLLAYTSDGDGPKSSVEVARTMEDGVCIDLDLGLGSGTIQDGHITASSVHNASTPAKNGRLNYTSGLSWCAGTSDTNPYLQIDLQKLHIICAVSTQGNSQADQWVKSYTLQLSTNGTTWTDWTESGKAKVLIGNDDRNSEVKHFVYGVLTRYLRFLPKTHQGGVCMRTEVFGEEKTPTCDVKAIGLADGGKIPDSSFTATSIYDCRYLAQNGRLNKRRAWAPKRTNNADDYLQIDLLYEYIICAVATQGNPSSYVAEWTTHYKIRLSLNNATFDTYKENNNDKVFPGNTDKDSTVINSLDEFASARFIRLVPIQFYKWKSLRVEVYGVPISKVPSQPPTSFNLTARSSTSIIAYWQLPPVFAGRIKGFKLFFREKGTTESFAFLNITSGSTLGRLVTGLDKYKEYEFQVLAYTSGGDGPKSSVEAERTMEDVPSLPPGGFTLTATNSSSVSASWQLPPGNSTNGIIRGFKLFCKKKDSSGPISMFLISNQETRIQEVTGLDEYTEYEFEILAFTSVGDGPTITAVFNTKEAGKPIIEDLPKKTIKSIGERVVLTCEVSGDHEASVTWIKDGLSRIPRAQLENNGKRLIIKDVVPGDSGVYECKAVNMFGESRKATIVIVAVPPRIMHELSPSSVMCEKQTRCFLSCQVTSYIPFNFSWTKDGQLLTGANMKLLSNSVIVTPRDGRDYGDYVCHATNSFGSTEFKITLLAPKDNQHDDDTQGILVACVITLSCIVVVLLMTICGLLWRRRRAVPYKRMQTKKEVDLDGVKFSPDQQSSDEQASHLKTYVELKPLSSNQESHVSF